MTGEASFMIAVIVIAGHAWTFANHEGNVHAVGVVRVAKLCRLSFVPSHRNVFVCLDDFPYEFTIGFLV